MTAPSPVKVQELIEQKTRMTFMSEQIIVNFMQQDSHWAFTLAFLVSKLKRSVFIVSSKALTAETILMKIISLASWRSSSENPFEYKIRICLIIVDLPDSPAPEAKISTACKQETFHSIQIHTKQQ